MFKKPLAHQSNATPLRSSARRQLLSSISAQYPGLVPSEGDEDGQSPTTMTAKEVGKLVLPEGVRTTTFETSAGIEGVSNDLCMESTC
jgi:translation initiation factor 2D